MTAPVRAGLAAALTALAGWLALLSWRGLADDPGRVTRPLLIGAVLIAVVGWGIRRVSGPWAALAGQLVVVLGWSVHRVSGAWLPTPGGVRALVEEIHSGITASQLYYSPVSAKHPEFHFMLTMAGLAILLALDLLACGLGLPAIAGLGLLLTVTISASILLDGIPLLPFGAAALCWMALLVLREAERTGGPRLPAGLLPTATTIALVTVLVAAFLTSGLGSQGRLFKNAGGGGGTGEGDSLDLVNPLLDMRRDLRQTADINVVDINPVNGDDVPSYVRISVLDAFNGASWYPTTRGTAETEPVEGTLPHPAGLPRSASGSNRVWLIHALPVFRSHWLPVPVPTSRLDVSPEWRYDPITLDVLSHSTTTADLRYRADTFSVQIDPDAMRSAGRAPASVQRDDTALPKLPTVFRQVANKVTAGATSDWDRAVLLQDWFRTAGGFTYSTQPASGNGIETLERFITTDKIGYCEQFATAMATLARTLGIPARVSVGFLHSSATGGGTYTFSTQDLHAWPELYFRGAGWVRFEPTPGVRTGNAPSYTDNQVVRSPTASASPSASAKPTAPTSSPTAAPTQHRSSAGGGDVWWWLGGALLVLVVAALAALPWLLRRDRERRRWARARDPRGLADAAWADVRETSLDLDLGWSETASVRVNGAHVQEAVAEPAAREALGEVVRIVELTRYAGAHGAGRVTRDQLRADVARWRAAAYDEADVRVSRRARWWPKR